MKTKVQQPKSSLRTRTEVKAGALSDNHAETVATSLPVKTTLKAGIIYIE